MPFHAHGQRLQPAQGQETVEGAADASHGILQETQSLLEFPVVADDRKAADHVRVAVDVLGDRMDDDVEAHAQRPLAVGRGERVVDHRQEAPPPGQRGDGRQIDQFQQWVGGAFHPHHAGIGADGRFQDRQVRRIDVSEIQIGAAVADLLEQPDGAAVEIVTDDHVRTVLQQVEHGGNGRQSGGERKTRLALLQVGHATLKGKSRGVLAPARSRSLS